MWSALANSAECVDHRFARVLPFDGFFSWDRPHRTAPRNRPTSPGSVGPPALSSPSTTPLENRFRSARGSRPLFRDKFARLYASRWTRTRGLYARPGRRAAGRPSLAHLRGVRDGYGPSRECQKETRRMTRQLYVGNLPYSTTVESL